MMNVGTWLAAIIHDRRTRKPRRTPRRGPERNPEYRQWVRSQWACAACGVLNGIEAAHTGPHGLSSKSPDRTCIPLCNDCHQTGPNALHRLGPVAFQATWKLDIEWLVGELNRHWRQR